MTALAAAAMLGAGTFSLSASPAAIHAAAGSSERITVANPGGTPLTVSTSIIGLSDSCHAGSRQTPGIAVTPASFSLLPGGSRVAAVTISSTAPAQDDAVLFTASAGSGGNIRVAGAVGTQMTVGSAPECHPPAVAKAGSGSVLAARSSGDTVYLWLLTLLAIPGVIALRWRRRRSPSRQ